MTPTSATVQLVTFTVPGSSAEPMQVKVSHSGLRMVLVNRESVGWLDQSWKVLGVYFLLGGADDPDRYRAYVGEVGKSTLVQRVKQHAGQKEWWSRALLIASASDDFNSAEIGWLEGRLYDVLNNAVACEVMNGNRPGDESLSLAERGILERYIEPIMAALRALGASPDTADQKPVGKGRKKPMRYSESVSDLIEAGLLKPETVLQPLRKGLTQTARVRADGKLDVGGAVYDSLSAAAKAAAGTVAEAGWDFWGAPSGAGGFVALAELRKRVRENGSKSAPVAQPEKVTLPTAEAGASGSATAPPPAFKPGDGSKTAALAAVAEKRPELFPLSIFSDYRGTRIEATVEPSGEIRLGGATFTSPSTAANVARQQSGYVGAGKVATNGWIFWRFVDEDGATKPLDQLRKAGQSATSGE